MTSLVKEVVEILIIAIGMAIIGMASPFATTNSFSLFVALGYSFIGLVILIVGLRFVWISGF
jgi:hypothetical protein